MDALWMEIIIIIIIILYYIANNRDNIKPLSPLIQYKVHYNTFPPRFQSAGKEINTLKKIRDFRSGLIIKKTTKCHQM